MGVGTGGEAPRFLGELLDRRRFGFPVIQSGRGHRRQIEDVGHLVAGRVGAGAEIEDRRDEDDAVERDVVERPLELVQDGRGAGGTVAFAAEIFGRVPAAILVEPQTNELGDGLGVLGHAPIILRVGLAQSVAETRPDRIDEDDVGDVEKAFRIVDDRERRRAVIGAVGRDRDPFRPERAHVEPDRAGAGAAVEQEGDRPVRIARLAHVGRREDRRPGGSVLGAKEGLARRRRVADALAAESAGVARDRDVRRAVGRRTLRFLGILLGGDGPDETGGQQDKGCGDQATLQQFGFPRF